VVALLGGIAIVAVVAFAMTRGGKKEPDKVAEATKDKGITFEPIETKKQAPPPPQQTAVVAPPEVTDLGSAAVPIKTNPPSKKPTVRVKKDDPAKKIEPPKAGLTREAVGARFSATSRQYEAYKAKNGMQLDREWNELTSFIQFKMNDDNFDDAVRRIDAFRSKLRE
jgi:hypothetical protein